LNVKSTGLSLREIAEFQNKDIAIDSMDLKKENSID
jgi:hypothetical protein